MNETANVQQADKDSAARKQIFFCCCLSCVVCVATLALLVALSVTVMFRVSRIETSLQAITDDLRMYAQENSQSVAEIKSTLEALDYKRLNEAIEKLDKLDNINVDELQEAVKRINAADFNGVSESVSDVSVKRKSMIWTRPLCNQCKKCKGRFQQHCPA